MASAFSFKLFFMTAVMYPDCGMYWSYACNRSSSAVRFSVLDSQSLRLFLEKKAGKKQRSLPALLPSTESAILLHFLSLSLDHMSPWVCHCHVLLQRWMLSLQFRELESPKQFVFNCEECFINSAHQWCLIFIRLRDDDRLCCILWPYTWQFLLWGETSSLFTQMM